MNLKKNKNKTDTLRYTHYGDSLTFFDDSNNSFDSFLFLKLFLSNVLFDRLK
jgi:hypothetical protein